MVRMLRTLLLLAASQIGDPVLASADGDAVEPSRQGELVFRNYPPRALAAGEQGSVGFRTKVDARGHVLSCEITLSSGYWRLDEETCALIVRHAVFRPSLDEDGRARPAIHDGTVNWRIAGRANAHAPRTGPTEVPDKIICKRSPKTGSLTAHTRLCMTRREWTELAEQYQEDWGSLQGRKGSSHGTD